MIFTKDKYPIKCGEWTYDQDIRVHGSYEAVEIGKFCSFAPGLELQTGGEHYIDFASTYPFEAIPEWGEIYFNRAYENKNSPNIVIKNDVWTGINVLVKHGVTIGNGAIIGMGAVVTRDIPDYAIAVGVPAKVIAYRFSPSIIKDLLEVCWWDFPYQVIKELIPFMGEIEVFISKCREKRA